MSKTSIATGSASEPIVSITYSLTWADLFRGLTYAHLRHRGTWLILAFVGVFTWFNLRPIPEPVIRVAMGVVITLFFFLILLVAGSMQRLGQQRRVPGGWVLEIREDGLLERTNVTELLHRWVGFHKIISTPRDLYIYASAARLHIIPKRFFASDKEAEAFEAELRRRIDAARPATQARP